MNLISITINHNTAPIELRESLHLSRNEIVEYIPRLKEFYSDGVIISTCNRTELIVIPKNYSLDSLKIIQMLLDFKPVKGIEQNNFRSYFSCGAVKHLFSVASGIDSLIIGDSQILGQVKEAFEISEDVNFSSPLLKRIFDTAIKVGRRAIKETEIGDGAVTISYAAVQVVEKIFSSLEKKSALVIGAGETGELAAVHLKDKNVGKITIANRTPERAELLAKKLNGNIISFEALNEYLHNYDIIVSATSAENYIISMNDILSAMKKRRSTPMVLMDIAIPRDIDPQVRSIDNVFYNDMDSLKIIIDQNMQKRKSEIPKVEKIILEEMVNFFGWYNALEVVPTIKSLREFFDNIRNDELEKIKHKINEEDFNKIDDMTRRMMGRILHNPTIKLRELAESGTNFEQIMANTLTLKELFELDKYGKNGTKQNTLKDNN